jgi:hypothetical protein
MISVCSFASLHGKDFFSPFLSFINTAHRTIIMLEIEIN